MPGTVAVWLWCEGYKRTFPNLGLARNHQCPGPGSRGQHGATNWTRRRPQTSGAAACTRADIVSVTVHEASGLQRPRVTVVCVHAGTGQSELGQQQPSQSLPVQHDSPPIQDARSADMDWHELDYVQDAEAAVDRAQTQMRDVLMAVYAGGTLPVCTGCV
jgi:hypothetical protein